MDKFDSSEPDTLQHADEKVFSAQYSFSFLSQPTKAKTILYLMEPPEGLFKVRFQKYGTLRDKMSFLASCDYKSFPRFHVHDKVVQIWTAFKLFDKNGDGMVTKAEFRKVFQNQIASYQVGKMLHFKIELCQIKYIKCHISNLNVSFL